MVYFQSELMVETVLNVLKQIVERVYLIVLDVGLKKEVGLALKVIVLV